MSKQNQIAAHRVAMNSRTRMSFGRTFLATLANGGIHHDAAKLSAFLVANGVTTPADIKKNAKAGLVSLQTLSDMARRLIATKPADQIVMKYNLNA